MRRRDFISLAGGSAVAWPLAARAQLPRRMRRIGVLTPFPADYAEGYAMLTAFTQALQQLGWTVGQNIRIDYRWGPGNPATMRKYATELVALEPDVLLALTTAAVGPLLEASRTVPIVFVTVAAGVGAGFVETLARPGGNATGFTPYEYSISGKWLELLKEIIPRVTRAAVLRDTSIAVGLAQFGAVQAVAPSLGVELRPVDVHDAAEIERALAAVTRPLKIGVKRNLHFDHAIDRVVLAAGGLQSGSHVRKQRLRVEFGRLAARADIAFGDLASHFCDGRAGRSQIDRNRSRRPVVKRRLLGLVVLTFKRDALLDTH